MSLMKEIDFNAVAMLFDSFHYAHAVRLVHFCDSDATLCAAIADYCKEHDFEYQLNTPSKTFLDEVKRIVDAPAFWVPLERPKYKIGGKEHDYLLLTMPIDPLQRKDFLRRAHEIIRSHGKIVILLPKSERAEHQTWIKLLEETLYVATSLIDDLDAHHDAILSTKMHGWGERR